MVIQFTSWIYPRLGQLQGDLVFSHALLR